MLGKILGTLLFLVVTCSTASAQSCGSLPNALTNGTNADATQVMANFNFLLSCINSSSSPTFQAGQLKYVTATQISFVPLNGNQIKINGALNVIPSGGVAGCANTNVFVNGAAGSNLAAATLYYVYAFTNAGTVTCDFSSTGHVTSSAAGNAGTEIKSGDDTRSLIGMVRTNASSQFADSLTQRFVASWFNRRPRALYKVLGTYSTSSSNFVEYGGGAERVEFINWGGSGTFLQYLISLDLADNGSAGTTSYTSGAIDASYSGGSTYSYSGTVGNFFMPVANPFAAELTEGYHHFELFFASAVAGYTTSSVGAPDLAGLVTQ